MIRSRFAALFVVLATLVGTAGVGFATPVSLKRTEIATDYVTAGIAGVGTGTGNLEVTGVSGTVTKAFLYWHGIDQTGAGGLYDNETISFGPAIENAAAGASDVTGQSLGDATTNCWGPGSSRAFFADVTDIVDGNGDYTIGGLGAKTGHTGNGASLIVLFDDGNPNNDRDLVFFEGNDSSLAANPGEGPFPGESDGWAATLNNINYGSGAVFAQAHCSDGQSFPESSITFTSSAGLVTIPDSTLLWDSKSVPNAGNSRAGSDGLWDIHTFDISAAFDDPGNYTVALSGQAPLQDCLGLVVMMIDLAAGAAPCGNGTIDEGEDCDPAAQPSGCTAPESCLTSCTCGCDDNSDCNDGVGCTIDSCNTETGQCTNDDSSCGCPRDCGDPAPAEGSITAVDAGYILRVATGLEKCLPCICDVDDSGDQDATDALITLQYAVDLPLTLNCPDFVAPVL